VAFSSKKWFGVEARLNGQPTTPDGKQFRHNVSGRKTGEKNSKMMVLQQGKQTRRSPKMEHMRLKDTQKQQKYNKNIKKYPQVRKTGVDEVHGKLPTDGLLMNKKCNLLKCVKLMIEI
jgi:hypothetical protein